MKNTPTAECDAFPEFLIGELSGAAKSRAWGRVLLVTGQRCEFASVQLGGKIQELCWSLQNRWLPVPIFLALAVGAFFAWMHVLRYSDDNASQRRDLLISTLMKAE
jgi:hypothetical protein